MPPELWRWGEGALLWRRSRGGCPGRGGSSQARGGGAQLDFVQCVCGRLLRDPLMGPQKPPGTAGNTVSLTEEPGFPVYTHVSLDWSYRGTCQPPGAEKVCRDTLTRGTGSLLWAGMGVTVGVRGASSLLPPWLRNEPFGALKCKREVRRFGSDGWSGHPGPPALGGLRGRPHRGRTLGVPGSRPCGALEVEEMVGMRVVPCT